MPNTVPNRKAICDVLLERAATDKDIVVLCSDSRGSASLAPFFEQFPAQAVEVGIAEQDLVSIAAGLASCGKKAFAASPASFVSTRSYEQAKVDCAYSNTNVTLIGISGGVSYGALGMSHHSAQDIAAMSAIPNMRVYLPSDRFQTACLINALLEDDKPAYVRVGRNAVEDVYAEDRCPFEMDRATWLAHGTDVAIVACGEMVKPAYDAAKLLEEKGIDVEGIVKGVQPICFENAVWAYTLGTAIAVKRGLKNASECAAAIGEGLEAFTVPGSVAEQRKVGLGHGNLGAMLLNDDTNSVAVTFMIWSCVIDQVKHCSNRQCGSQYGVTMSATAFCMASSDGLSTSWSSGSDRRQSRPCMNMLLIGTTSSLNHTVPQRLTEAGVAYFRFSTSNRIRTLGGSERRSPVGSVSSLLSSRTELRFSAHSGSTSPSNTIHCRRVLSPRTSL